MKKEINTHYGNHLQLTKDIERLIKRIENLEDKILGFHYI